MSNQLYRITTGNDIGDIKPVIIEGEMDGLQYRIYSFGNYPTAYVEATEEQIDEFYDYGNVVHGGFTFSGTFPNDEDQDRKWLGWDYAHAGDYVAFFHNLNDAAEMLYGEPHKYTVQEIMEDIKRAVKMLKGENNEQD